MSQVINVHFDTSELNRSLAALNLVSDKLPSQLVNQKGFFIFSRARKNMKVVSRETITNELGAEAKMTRVLLKSGKVSRAKKNIKNFFSQGAGDTEGFPLLAAIIQARARKSGKGSPWKGVDRATGAQRMLDAMRTVFSARIRSRGYYAACLGVAREVYRRANKLTSGKTFSTTDSFNIGSLTKRRGIIADVTLATEGQSRAVSTFWVKDTEHDTGRGLHEHLEPVLQEACDNEAGETFRHSAELEYKSAIKALGIRVS